MDDRLQHIANTLLLNGSLTECPGLIHGKMGIALFFYHYAQYTGNRIFSDYAFELLEKIMDQIHATYRADYEKGLAGIGVGISFLIHGDFLEATDDLFEDFDERMYRAVMYDPWTGFGLFEGLSGLGRYWILRSLQGQACAYAKACLSYIIKQIDTYRGSIPADEWPSVAGFLYDLRKFFHWDLPSHLQVFQISTSFNQTNHLHMRQEFPELGLLNGYAGEGLQLMENLGLIPVTWESLLLTHLSDKL